MLYSPHAPEFDHFSLKDEREKTEFDLIISSLRMKGQRQEWSKIIKKGENVGKRDRLMSFSSFDEGWSVLSP